MSRINFKKTSYLHIVRLGIPILISFALHFGLVVGLNYVSPGAFDGNIWKKDHIAEVELIFEKKFHPEKVYVKDPEVDDQLLSRLTKKVDRLSRKARRVREQTIARQSGPSQNAPSKSSRASKSLSLSATDVAKLLHASKERPPKEGFSVKSTQRKQRQNNKSLGFDIGFLESRQSSLATYHPHIKVADITALDTDKGLLEYYTFHVRLLEQLRPRWIHTLRGLFNSIPKSTLKRMGRVERITTLEVILDKEGQYVGAMIVNSSQERLLDLAARESFKDAAPFVNPPKDMIEEDGYIYLPFSFRVEINMRHLARSR